MKLVNWYQQLSAACISLLAIVQLGNILISTCLYSLLNKLHRNKNWKKAVFYQCQPSVFIVSVWKWGKIKQKKNEAFSMIIEKIVLCFYVQSRWWHSQIKNWLNKFHFSHCPHCAQISHLSYCFLFQTKNPVKSEFWKRSYWYFSVLCITPVLGWFLMLV